MTNFPDYLTEEQKEFWSNLDELQIVDYPDSQIYSVTFGPNDRAKQYCAIIFSRHYYNHEWTYAWVDANGARNGKPYIIRKPKEVPFTIEDILDISNNWFRAKEGGTVLHKISWLNTRTVCVGLSELGGMSIDTLVENYEHSPNGKDWYSLTKKV